MNVTLQNEFHQICQEQRIESGYNASELVCFYCMCGTPDKAAVALESLSEQHALEVAAGAYNDDAHLALNMFLRSRHEKC